MAGQDDCFGTKRTNSMVRHEVHYSTDAGRRELTRDRGVRNLNGDRMQTATIIYPDGGVLGGMFFLASYTDAGPYNDATTFQAELQSSGPVSYTPRGVIGAKKWKKPRRGETGPLRVPWGEP